MHAARSLRHWAAMPLHLSLMLAGTLLHLGTLHSSERALVLLVAFGPFVVLVVVVVVLRRRDVAAQRREEHRDGDQESRRAS